MISKSTILSAFVAAVVWCACGAEVDPSVSAAYYNKNLKDKPQGVYEWTERDLLFVQVHIPYDTDGSENIDTNTLLAEHRELYSWLASKATKIKKDSMLSPGLDKVRNLVRANYPDWEYTADWEYRFTGQSFSREEDGKRIACVVCKKSAVESSMPKSFLEPVADSVWLDGARELIRQCYSKQVNVPFMVQIGLYDCAEMNGWKSAPAATNAAYREYLEVRRETADYLASSTLANELREAQKSLQEIPVKTDVAYTIPPEIFVTNVVVSVSTNFAVAANSVTNVAEVPFVGIADVMPSGGMLVERSIKCDESIITTVETSLVVRTRKVLVHRIAKDYRAASRFESLFLSDATKENLKATRTERGKAAEHAFFGVCAQNERDRLVLEALRENPGDKVLWNLYGRILSAKKDWSGALICFRNSLRLDCEYQYALTNLALTYRDMGKRELAIPAAIVAYGLSVDDWCKKQSESVLRIE